MKTVTLTDREVNVVYAALREALTRADEAVMDAQQFPEELDEALATEYAVSLNDVLNKLA